MSHRRLRRYRHVPSPQQLVFPDDATRRVRPAPLDGKPFHPPGVQTFQLDGGISVYLVEQHVLPIVQLQLEIEGGSIIDPADRIGQASLMMAMLGEGTERLDKIAYAEALADVASSISASAGEDTFTLSLASLTEHVDKTVELFVEVLRTPGFRKTDFVRLLERRVESVKQSRSAPQSILGRVVGRVAYGPEHPFGTVVTEASLRAITLEHCRELAATWLRPEGAKLFVVGDLDEQGVRRLFDGGRLGMGAPPKAPEIPDAIPMAGRSFFVRTPDASQSQVSYLQHGPRRQDPSYYANAMLGAVYGGGFASRLNQNLRESKGLSYGVRGGFSYTRTTGMLTAGGPVAGSSAEVAVVEIERELRELASGERPVEQGELDREKQGAILALPGRFATAQAALGQYRALVYYGLPLDDVDRYAERVEGVTVAEVDRSARREIRPDEGRFVVVGDAPVGDDVVVLDPDANVL